MREVLRGGDPLAHEYPLVFEAGFDGRVVVLEEGDVTLSCCAILPRTLVVGRDRVRAGFIGSVVTRADQRGKGHASRVLEFAESELRRLGCTHALLWADDRRFYEARGWRSFGHEIDIVLPSGLESVLPEPREVRRARSSDTERLHALNETQAARVERSRAECAALFAIPGMDLLVSERDGAVVAYACMGRGADLQRVVHEWAGATEDVLALLSAHMRARVEHGDREDLYMMAPTGAHELELVLRALGAPVATGILALVKPLTSVALPGEFEDRAFAFGLDSI